MKLATLCYLRADGKTLMVQRTKRAGDIHFGKWNGLGGKFEPGETPEECARREIKEESGLDVEQLTWKGLLTFPGFAYDEDWYAFVFTAIPSGGELTEPEEGYLAWIDDNKLLELNLWEGDRHFLPWIDQPGFFSGKFNYKEGMFMDYEVTFYPA
jgi:8-oxo-dGTP diphosphatase